ncbi:unnamed protein product [Rodentolepis nana]|uniref:HECT domain-containing protein n=1 Tax=Rodentolepis nana TaxID=102285 RepID=A0A0R3T124_RODNA|nr:unnamed protein product [Rodentolepis nana]
MSTLYGWGSCEVGQLGPVSTEESGGLVCQPTVINWPPPGVGKHLIKLSCGYQHTLALDSEGLVYSSGSNEFGQLGHKRQNNAFVSGIKEHVRDVVAGPYHSAAITVTGRVYMWGCNTNHQLGRDDFEDNEVGLLNFNHGTIVQISLGLEHTVALTEASEIYTWGSNSQGQLGLGYCSQQPMTTPQLVEALIALPVRQIVAGANHNVIVTPSGSVYVWGSNTQGQLGLGEAESQSNTPVLSRRSRSENSPNSKQGIVSVPTPRLLKSVKRRGVVYVACGETHSTLLTKDGAVFTFGDGRFGQLGHGPGMTSVGNPRQVMELMGDTCVQLVCGRRHTLVVVCNPFHSPPRPRPIIFGCGYEGQLGQPNLQKTFLPVNVIGPWHSREASPANFITNSTEPTVTAVFAGGNHCFALTHHSGLSCPPLADFRKWQPCHLSNIATISEPLIRRYINGFTDHQLSASTRRLSSTSNSEPPDISEATYCLEHYSMKSAFKRLEVAFGSIGCLASSLLLNNANRSHYNIGKADHGMDLDSAQALQTDLFLVAPVSDARCLIRPLLEAISRPRSNFPDLECLRVFVFLAVSPLLDTPRKDTFNLPDSSVEVGTGPTTHYPTVLAGYAIGFVLSAFARAVCRLEGVPLSVLDSWFTDFQPRFFRRLVANLTNFVAFRYCSEHPVEEVNCFNNQSATHASLELLKRLHDINQKRTERISYMAFYIPELTDRFNDRGFANWLIQRHSNEKQIDSFAGQCPPPRRFRIWRSKSVPPKPAHNNNNQNFTIFDYPFVFDVACKAKMLQTEARLMQEMAMQNFSNAVLGTTLTRLLGPIPQTYLTLEVSRENLISNTLDYLTLRSKADLKRPLKVRFAGEEAIDDGGVLKEFFILIMREILNPAYGMFKVYKDSRMLWFNETNFESPHMFAMVGALCGLAIYNNNIIDLCFPTALFKKLLDEEPTLDDLKELDPTAGRSLQSLLDYEGTDVEDVFCINFEIAVDHYGVVERVPLIPNGCDIPVDHVNKELYVEKYLDFRFNRSCKDVFEAFKKGFFDVCSGYVIRMFQPTELHSMVVGSDEIDWQELRKHTNYNGEYWDRHPIIQWFWDVLINECTLQDKKNFLRFLTGCDRMPIFGVTDITIQPNNSGDEFLPVAHTCYNILDLPKYSSKEILATKLKQAIENTEGFGLV